MGLIKICIICGKQYEAVTERQIYCSRGCAAIRRPILKLTCKSCGKTFYAQRERNYCSKNCCDKFYKKKIYIPHERVYKRKIIKCPQCGKEFSKDRKYCSVECYKKSRNQEEKKKYCFICGKEILDKSHRYCSEECRKNKERISSREKSASKKPMIKRICKNCGKTFIPEYGNKRRTFCSEACEITYESIQKHKSKRHREKVKEQSKKRDIIISKNKIGSFTYKDVFENAQGKCEICGLPVSKNKHLNNNWGGTIDHIIPLTLNGKHSLDNCQLAHNVCNALKLQEKKDFSMNWIEESKNNPRWKNKLEQYINDMLISGELKLVNSIFFISFYQ